jgi:hypothetical protein
MTVKVYEKTNNLKPNWITRFLTRHHVQHQLVSEKEIGVVSQRNYAAAVEVDGHIFIDPNEDALKKILHVA